MSSVAQRGEALQLTNVDQLLPDLGLSAVEERLHQLALQKPSAVGHESSHSGKASGPVRAPWACALFGQRRVVPAAANGQREGTFLKQR